MAIAELRRSTVRPGNRLTNPEKNLVIARRWAFSRPDVAQIGTLSDLFGQSAYRLLGNPRENILLNPNGFGRTEEADGLRHVFHQLAWNRPPYMVSFLFDDLHVGCRPQRQDLHIAFSGREEFVPLTVLSGIGEYFAKSKAAIPRAIGSGINGLLMDWQEKKIGRISHDRKFLRELTELLLLLEPRRNISLRITNPAMVDDLSSMFAGHPYLKINITSS
jgi:hypothetical protein